MNKPIFKMTGNKDLDCLLTKINDGSDINIQDEHGYTALIISSSYGYFNICKELIKYGTDVNIQNEYGTSALMRAAFNGYIGIVKLLIENNSDINIQNNDGEIALMWGSYNGNIDVCKLLVENGADIDIQNSYGNTAVDIMKGQEIYNQIAPYKIIGLKYFKEVFREYAEDYMDIFETTLYSHDLELTDIKANIDMFYSTIFSRMENNAIDENMEL